MRGSFGLFKNGNGIGGQKGIANTTKLVSCSTFSTSSSGGSSGGGGGGGGRGRGGFGPPKFDFVAGKTDSDEGGLDNFDNSAPGIGRGRGKPLNSTPYLPSFNTFVASKEPVIGRGRGDSGNGEDSNTKKPIFLRKDEATGTSSVADSVTAVPRQPIGEKNLPQNILSVLTGSGRGSPGISALSEMVDKEVNRHIRPRERGLEGVESRESSESRGPKLTRDEAVKKAVGILSRREDPGEGGGERGVGRGRGRVRGRGRGRGGVGGRGRGRSRRDDWDEEEEDDDKALYMGDDADGEKLAKFLGPERMNELTEAFEEMSTDILPDAEEDEYIEALDTNLKIELEPEYLLGDFETNPDIDDKPPMSLQEALEKMKPFLMAYEGIESQEEWEEVVKEAMERVPLLKEIVDHYCGPDRVTAKQQQEELERVAKTLPASAPDSVKRYSNRAMLSLQSNPGWGFDRKCQFMDKLMNEFSKSYK